MSLCFYISPLLEDFSCLIEEESRTDHTDIDFSVVFLFSYDAVLLVEQSILIRYECYAEIVLIAELRMRYIGVLGYSDYLDTELRKIRYESSEILCLECASWSIILRVEVEESEWGFLEERSDHTYSVGDLVFLYIAVSALSSEMMIHNSI
jgi:hypothetical protein